MELKSKSTELIKRILPLTQDKFPDQQKILDICDEFAKTNEFKDQAKIKIQILFLTGLLNEIIKPFPLRLYPDEETRMHLIDTIQDMIDDLVTTEEDAEELDHE